MARDPDVIRRVGVVAAVLAGIGTVLPWVTASDPLIGTVSRSGLVGVSEGLTILVAAIVGLIGMLIRTYTGAVAAGIAGLVGLALAIYDYANVSTLVATLGLPGEGGPGVGMYVSMIGGATLAAIAFYGARVLRNT